jgi:hypothetical protein
MSPEATTGWREASERYWTVLSKMPGAPRGLRVVDLDSGAECTLGDGDAYEIHGSAAELREVLTGRVALIHAAFEGKVFIRGTFAELSVLTGACFAIADGAAADD